MRHAGVETRLFFVLIVPPTGTGWKHEWKENIQEILNPAHFNMSHALIEQ